MLDIYKASAGSGKTFALTLEYFKIIFSVPSEYRNILAVTFTNKATEEMKSRIINELHCIAEGRPSGYAPGLKERFGFRMMNCGTGRRCCGRCCCTIMAGFP